METYIRVPRRDDNVLDGPKRTVLQIMSILSIHDACVVELKRSLWIAYHKGVGETREKAKVCILSTIHRWPIK
jgi:hypothetical protein